MKNNHVFPYDAVKRDSNIIIYGLGFLGKLYIEQIERTNYCRIEAVSDQNNKKNYKNYRFVEINKIKEETVANIIIAISDVDIASNAYWSLVSVGVDEKRIVSAYQTNIGLFPCYRPESEPAVMVKRIRVAVTLAGGIGDYVVFISFVRKLIDVVPDATIDIYGNKTIVEAVFPRISNVSKVFNDDEESIKSNKLRKNYEVAFKLVHFAQIEYCDFSTVKYLSPELYCRIKKMITDPVTKDLMFITGKYREIYDRAKILGYDRYRFLGQGDIWNLSQDDSRMELDDEFEEEYKRLGLNQYITFNYGAAEIKNYEGRIQTKVWPLDHYKKLIEGIKNAFPGIEVVQLGDDRCYRFKEADRNIINADLRLVKHVLANAIVHIDGEGGLVHIASQLKTKCIVIFGPTPHYYYAYNNNCNIVSKTCKDCCHVKEDWYIKCLIGDLTPRCMASIDPKTVLKSILFFLYEGKR